MSKDNQTSIAPWKTYITITIESLVAFYLATFSLAMYFTHRDKNWLIPFLILVALYLFVIFACAKRIMEKLSIAALMIIIPIAPLLALIMVISLIPLLEVLK